MGRIAAAEFLPPEALARLDAWRQEHHDVLDRIPDDEITFDIGRAQGGTFAGQRRGASRSEIRLMATLLRWGRSESRPLDPYAESHA